MVTTVESVKDSVSSHQELPMERRDLVKEVIDSESFDERKIMVGGILNTELPTMVKSSQDNSDGDGINHDGTESILLPPLARFTGLFDSYIGEVSAAPGSYQASNKKNKHPLEVGKLPTGLRSRYQISIS